MNKQQRTAIENPCRLAMETTNPAFNVFYPRTQCSVTLTVNSGYE